MLLNFFWLAKNLKKMKIFGLANFRTFFKKTCTNNPTSEIQIAPFEKFFLNFLHIINSKKNSFRRNYLRKYGNLIVLFLFSSWYWCGCYWGKFAKWAGGVWCVARHFIRFVLPRWNNFWNSIFTYTLLLFPHFLRFIIHKPDVL